jgi:hypothetical protein
MHRSCTWIRFQSSGGLRRPCGAACGKIKGSYTRETGDTSSLFSFHILIKLACNISILSLLTDVNSCFDVLDGHESCPLASSGWWHAKTFACAAKLQTQTSNNRLPTAARQPCSATRLPDRSACTCRRPLRHLKHDSSSTDLLGTVSTLPTFNDSSTTSSASRARYVDLLGFMHKLSASFFLNYFYGFNLFRRSALHVFSALLIPPPRHARGLGNANT